MSHFRHFYGQREKCYVPEGKSLVYASELSQARSKSDTEQDDIGHFVHVDALLIDKYPVTRIEFLNFVNACDTSKFSYASALDAKHWETFDTKYPYDDDAPIVSVTFEEALAYCRAHGGRLPSLAEWNRAARGNTAWDFPWGEKMLNNYCNIRHDLVPDSATTIVQHLTKVNKFPHAASEFGVCDCIGNCREWTMTAAIPTLVDCLLLGRGKIVDASWLAEIPDMFNKNVEMTNRLCSVRATVVSRQHDRFSIIGDFPCAGRSVRNTLQGFRVAYDVSRIDHINRGKFRKLFATAS